MFRRLKTALSYEALVVACLSAAGAFLIEFAMVSTAMVRNCGGVSEGVGIGLLVASILVHFWWFDVFPVVAFVTALVAFPKVHNFSAIAISAGAVLLVAAIGFASLVPILEGCAL